MPDFDNMGAPPVQGGVDLMNKVVPIGIPNVRFEQIEVKPRDGRPVLDQAALYGLVGDIVTTIEPHTESDPVAILAQSLVNFGNLVGRVPYYPVESTRHHANLFVVLVGASSKARKGTSADRVRAVFDHVDHDWAKHRIKSGLSSGEGLINEVRDPVTKWNDKEHVNEVVDEGAPDKRLMTIEGEFANLLAVMDRPGNTVSVQVRHAWDGKTLETLTVSKRTATDPHISIVGHITERELKQRLTKTESFNGFGNRFMFFCVRRSKNLPFGGNLDPADIEALGGRVREAAEFAKTAGRIHMAGPARSLWASIYDRLSAEQDGLLGAVTARAEAQTIRLAVIYALMDQRTAIEVHHLQAASAVWEYAATSAARIFGDSLGDPVADEIIAALRLAGIPGMTRTAINNLFGGRTGAPLITATLASLAEQGLAIMERRKTAGRPVETWFITKKGVPP